MATAASSTAAQPLDVLLDSYRFSKGSDKPNEGREPLTILDPLLRFYAPRLARLTEEQLAHLRQPPSPEGGPLDPSRVVDWLIDPCETHDELKVLICMVADPSLSGSAYYYDSTVAAMLLALRNTGYVLDGYRIEWKSPSGGKIEIPTTKPTSGKMSMSLAASEGAATARTPGVVLLRKLAPGQGAAEGHHELAVLLLVPETPVKGVDTAIFQTSLDIAAKIERKRCPPGPIRIIGPNFSGSVSSIVRTLKPWLEDLDPSGEKAPPLCVRWINGAAVSLDVDRIEKVLASPKAKSTVDLKNVIYGTNEMQKFALQYLKDHVSSTISNARLAFLSEETTGYGALATKAAQSHELDGFHIYQFTFPAQIAEVRQRYARQGQSDSSSSPRLRTAARLHFDQEQSEKSEFLRPEAPAFTSASDELRLLRVAEQINDLDIRFVYLSATDVRDSHFVAEFIRTNCPDALVVLPQAEPTFTREDSISLLRGTLFVSNHPMWVFDADRPEQIVILPDQSAYGVYNATLAQLLELARPEDQESIERELFDYDWKSADGEHRGPALWMTVASQKGLLPLAAEVPPEHDPKAKGGGWYAGRLWLPPSTVPGNPLPTHSQLFWARVPVLSGVSWVLPIFFFVVAAIMLYICYERNSRVRTSRLGDERYPLPSPPDVAGPFPEIEAVLRRCADKDRILNVFAGASLRVYGHWELLVLGCVMFCGMLAYAWVGGHHLSRGNWIVPLTVAIVMLAVLFEDHLSRNASRGAPTPLTRTTPLAYGGLGAGSWWIARDPLPGLAATIAAVLAITAIAFLLVRVHVRHRDRPVASIPVVFGVLLWSMFVGYLASSLSTMEQLPGLPFVLGFVLAGLFGIVIHIAIYLHEYWHRLDEWTESILSLPMGDAFDRLPLRLTSRLGNLADAWMNGGDPELDDRLPQLRANLGRRLISIGDGGSGAAGKLVLYVGAETAPALARIVIPPKPSPPATDVDFEVKVTREITRRLVAPLWGDRGAAEAFSDQDARKKDEAKTTPASRSTDSLALDAETYLALALARYLNGHLELFWVRVTALTVSTLLLVAAVNCYPFQPAGTLFQWTMSLVVVAVTVLIRSLVGFHRNGLISRVNKLSPERSLWNIDFLGKFIAYVGPVIALFAALSVSMSDLMRLVLGPLLR